MEREFLHGVERMVYFAQAGDRVKIGCSTNPRGRLTQIGEWSPYKPTIVALVSGGFALEKKLHAYFSDSWSHGEWFVITPKIEAVIKDIADGATLNIPDVELCSDRFLARRIKASTTRRVRQAEKRVYGWLNNPDTDKIRPQYVKDALESYASHESGPPSDEALAAIARYEEELASLRPLTLAKLADAVNAQ